MRLKQFFKDDDAVSPVIGVILMVAITVILAAVIATFVLGLGEQVSDSAPNASFNFDYTDESAGSDVDIGTDSGDAYVNITHSGGPNIDDSQLSIAGDQSGDWTESDNEISAGDSISVGVNYGDRISVVWENQEGTESSTLQRFDVPDN